MKTFKINLYKFYELSDEAKEKAIYEALNILDSEPTEYENENGSVLCNTYKTKAFAK